MTEIEKLLQQISDSSLSKEEYLTLELFTRYFSNFHRRHEERFRLAHEYAKKIIEVCKEE